MPSSYTPSLRLVLPVTGELQGAWGDAVNNGLTSLVDASIAGTAAIAMTDANRTLSANNELPDEARCMFINLTGTLTVTRDVICPAVSKLYFVHNGTNQSIVFRTLLGTGVTVVAGSRFVLYCNATNVVPAVDDLPAASKVAGVQIVTVSDTQTLTNKTLTSPAITTPTGIVKGDVGLGNVDNTSDATKNSATATLTNKTLNLTSNTLVATSAQIAAAVTDETGTGSLVFATSPTLVTPALGTPSSGVLTNATGLPISTGVSGLGTGVATFLGTPSSANLRTAVTDETGTGSLVFATSPTLVTPALGTPSSGVVTNLTGTASININGTVGATTASTGAFTTLAASSPASFAAGTAALPSITRTGDTNTGMFFPAADTIAFSEGGVEAMRITSAGNVGIGTTAASFPVSIGAANRGVDFSGDNRLSLKNANSSAHTVALDSFGPVELAADTNANTPSGALITFKVSDTERMRITSAGNVGIGTSSPTAKLDVHREIRVTQGQDQYRFRITDTDGNGRLLVDGDTSSLIFGTSGAGTGATATERMRITSSGNLLVGTTSTTPNPGIVFGPSGFISTGNNAGSSGFTFQFFVRSGAVVGSITQNGTTGVLYNITSDYRLKTVIGPVADAGERIDALQPVEYTWNSDGSRTRGFLAHQFQEVYASSVTGTKDAVDAEGKPVYQAMQASTSEVIADLVAELQSLRARVAALESN